MEILSCAMRGRSDGGWHESSHYQKLEIGGGISNSITSVQKDYLVVEIYEDNADSCSRQGKNRRREKA